MHWDRSCQASECPLKELVLTRNHNDQKHTLKNLDLVLTSWTKLKPVRLPMSRTRNQHGFWGSLKNSELLRILRTPMSCSVFSLAACPGHEKMEILESSLDDANHENF